MAVAGQSRSRMEGAAVVFRRATQSPRPENKTKHSGAETEVGKWSLACRSETNHETSLGLRLKLRSTQRICGDFRAGGVEMQGMFYGGTRLLIVVGRLCVTKRWRSRGQVDDKPRSTSRR
jgi:hypothetical protein